MSSPAELSDWIDMVVKNNTNLNFVDRIARPVLYPTLPLEDGRHATHLMSWSEVGKERTPIVYPTVIYDPETQMLKRLGDDEAVDHAMKTGEYLKFDSPESADLFSREYKRHWRPR